MGDKKKLISGIAPWNWKFIFVIVDFDAYCFRPLLYERRVQMTIIAIWTYLPPLNHIEVVIADTGKRMCIYSHTRLQVDCYIGDGESSK